MASDQYLRVKESRTRWHSGVDLSRMPRFPVSHRKEVDLIERMKRLSLSEAQMVETHLRRGGVSLLHVPTGIRVKAIRDRRQALNRFYARRFMVEELEARLVGKTRHEVKAEALHEQKVRRGRVPAARRKFNVSAAMNRFVVKPSAATQPLPTSKQSEN